MRNRFDRQLLQLNNELIEMGSLIEKAIEMAIAALVKQDVERAGDAIKFDEEIDHQEKEIEGLCMKLLLQQQPVARDLRLISAALKMITDMERIGDQASDIAEMADYAREGGVQSKIHIADMAAATIKMVTESVDSFVKKDINLARAVIKHDNIVDSLFDKLKSELIAAVQQRTANAETLIDLLMIAKYFERIGDHAENIAEWVIYSITGDHA